MNSIIAVVLSLFTFSVGFLIGNGFHEVFRYKPKTDELKEQIRQARHDAEMEQFKRRSAEREVERQKQHQIFEHIFKIETDADKCNDLFEPW